MNIQITAYGLGSGHDEAAGGSYDDTDLRKQIAAVAESARKIADTRKEYQAAYVPKKDFGNELNSNGFVTVKFKKPFSKIPFVKATVDLKTRSAQSINITNVTETSFEILDSSWDFDDMSGVWYEAHLID
nr:MAG TPA: H-type lectin domain [Caudoviricetes sp.]